MESALTPLPVAPAAGEERDFRARADGHADGEPAPAPPPPHDRRRALVAFALAGTALWALLCWRLSGDWSADEQYGYGWFVPVFALALGLLRWETRPDAAPPDRARAWRVGLTLGLLGLGLLAPVRLFQEANPDWRVLSWVHAATVAGLTLLGFWMVGGRPWRRHFAFPLGFFFVAVPWIKSIEEWTVQGLMRGIAIAAAEGMGLLGVPAQLEGNLLRVSTGTVGVNEACSGVRSLQTSLMIGLLLGELNRLSAVRRVALVAAAAALALAANLLRALILVWIAARHGLAAAERGHDAAGLAILGIVFLGTLALAALIRPRGRAVAASEEEAAGPTTPAGRPRAAGRALPVAWALATLAWLAVIEAGVEGWYRWHERDFVTQTHWTVHWPAGASGFRDLTVDERTWRLLRFDEGRAAAWRMGTDGGGTMDARCLAYFFRWKPGRNQAVLANAHRPDVCLPATGWVQSADRGVRFHPVATGLALPFRHFEFTRPGAADRDGTTAGAHVFYCLWEDRARAADAASGTAAETGLGDLGGVPAENSRWERVQSVLAGRRHLGQRVLEVALLGSTGQPASTVEAEAALGRLLNGGLVTPADPG